VEIHREGMGFSPTAQIPPRDTACRCRRSHVVMLFASARSRCSKRCSRRNCAADKIQLTHDSTMGAVFGAVGSLRLLPRESRRRFEEVHCSTNQLPASSKN
jgi:hypothetical protein